MADLQAAQSNVVPFRRPAERARSRNRGEALSVIVPRVRTLIAKGSRIEIAGCPGTIVKMGEIEILAVHFHSGETQFIDHRRSDADHVRPPRPNSSWQAPGRNPPCFVLEARPVGIEVVPELKRPKT